MRRWYWIFMSAGLVLSSSSMLQAVTLIDIAHDAVATNPVLLASAANRSARGYEVYTAVGQYLPHLAGRAAVGRQQSVNPVVRSSGKSQLTLTRSETALSASQLILDGWGVGSSIEQSIYTSRGAQYDTKNVCNSIILEVSEAYLNVKRTREILVLAQKNVKIHEETLRKAKISYRGGAGTRSDTSLAFSRLARARAQQRFAMSNLDTAITRFCTVAGQVPPEDLAMPLQPTRYFPRNLYVAIKLGMDKNPAILSAKSSAQAAGAHVGVTKSRFFPRVNAEFSATANNNLDGVEASQGDIRGMAVLNYDLIAGGSDLASHQAAKADRIKAQRTAQDVQRKVRELIRNAWTDFAASKDQIENFRDNVSSEEKVVIDYQKQFELGKRDLFILLDSQDDLYVAQTSLVNARYDNAVSYYRVLAAIGTLNLSNLS